MTLGPKSMLGYALRAPCIYVHLGRVPYSPVEDRMSADTLELSDIDEALRHLALVPEHDRGQAWRAFVDSVLDQRKGLDHEG